MKIIIAEYPESADRDISIEKEFLPKDAEIKVAVYTEETKADFIKECEDADAILTGYVPFDREMIDGLKNCKVISIAATGYNYVDVDYAAEKGIRVCAIGEYCTNEVADHTLMLILALTRGLIRTHRSVQEDKEWIYDIVDDIPRTEDLKLGIAGLGRIGRAVAKRAQAFGMEVIAYDPYLPEHIANDMNVKLVSIEELMETSDIISIHMNLTGENKEFFDYEKFKMMKKRPIFINVARGGVVNEDDLVRALDEGLIRGAGLDVLSSETPDLENCPLLGRDNVILTPHNAFYSKTSMYLLSRIPAENITACLAGEYDKANRIVNNVK